MKIAVIEDDNILKEILTDKLEGAGYQVVQAQDGQAAIDLIDKETPDLILLDVLLPRVSGTDVLRHVRESETLKSIPVIAISNTAEGSEVNNIKDLGVEDFLVKAVFDSNDVVERVNKVLQGRGGATEVGNSNDVGGNQGVSSAGSPSANVSTEGAPASQVGGSKKVLIIEDDKFLRELAAQKLEKEGFSVAGATNGQEGLDLLDKEAPNVIILDLILPGMDGFETLEKIRNESNFKQVPVIILSNLGQEEDIKKAKSLGATDYLIKAHFSFGEIIKKINEVLEG